MANASNLVIVESPSKAKTIGKYLGPDYIVKASMGHLRDLPKSKMGVDLESDFTPQYIPVKGKEELIKELKKDVDKAVSSPYSDVNDNLPKLLPDEQAIVTAIGKEERLVDDVIAETGLPVGKVLAMLTLLEVKGVVKRLPGKRVRL